MIAESLGFVHDSATCPSPPAAVSPDGLSGTAAGVTEAAFDAGPEPVPFKARIRKMYRVAFVSPVAVWDVVAAPLPEMSVQLPESRLYWYFVIDASFGLRHFR